MDSMLSYPRGEPNLMDNPGETQELEEAIARLIAQAESSPDRASRVERLQRAAQIYESQIGDPEKALTVWQAAFNEDFSDEASGQALERLAERLRSGAGLVADCKTLLGSVSDPGQRVALLSWLGRWQARFTQDRAAAEAYLLEAVRMDPRSRAAAELQAFAGAEDEEVLVTPPPQPFSGRVTIPVAVTLAGDAAGLHEQLDTFVQAGQWDRAVEALSKLAEGESGEMRGRYLATAGKILHHKMGQDDAAVEYLNRALDNIPDDLKLFERLYQILAGRRNWEEVEANILKMIARIKHAEGDNKPALEALWRRLGDVYRVGIKDMASAANAYQMCASLAPGDPRYPKLLAQMAGQAPE